MRRLPQVAPLRPDESNVLTVANPSKAKGTAFERAVATYFVEHGWPDVDRAPLRGNLDRGDLVGIPGWVLELKAHKSIDLGGYMAEVAVERVNAGVEWGAAIVKRRGKSIGDAYVVMDLSQFVELLPAMLVQRAQTNSPSIPELSA